MLNYVEDLVEETFGELEGCGGSFWYVVALLAVMAAGTLMLYVSIGSGGFWETEKLISAEYSYRNYLHSND